MTSPRSDSARRPLGSTARQADHLRALVKSGMKVCWLFADEAQAEAARLAFPDLVGIINPIGKSDPPQVIVDDFDFFDYRQSWAYRLYMALDPKDTTHE